MDWIPPLSEAQVNTEENAEQLQFGPVFSDASVAEPLLICEVAQVLKQKRAEGPAEATAAAALGPVFAQATEYVERFDAFKTPEAAKAVRARLERHSELHAFERAQLANLLPETAAEAKTVIPSLKGKIDDDALNVLLSDLAALVES
ncbi:hypothetical protein CDCA_CDCA03G0844 [Cyanidium caldarium]|uniref:RNA polymerase Rpb4/RPC9 core domain-containing protein n=1 Tax=Cyanidium caldarium TaxID=2771 RepID=A0AAV9IRD4_CYACA|nr:hypothetical protein CDCA_CDCA03G0844 [Cyanidium caldarium]|eukprot:ctg_762.g374